MLAPLTLISSDGAVSSIWVNSDYVIYAQVQPAGTILTIAMPNEEKLLLHVKETPEQVAKALNGKTS